MLAKRIEVAPDRSGEERNILTDNCLEIEASYTELASIEDGGWSYNSGSQIFKANSRDVDAVNSLNLQVVTGLMHSLTNDSHDSASTWLDHP